MENKQDFTQGSILDKILHFMLPILGALILQAMYGAVDMLVVGRFGSNAGISAVSTRSSIMNMVTFVLSALATGVMILLGRYLGEKRQEKIGPLVGNAVAFFLVLSVVLTVVLLVFARPIAVLMQAPAEAVDLTVQYLRICGAGIFFIIFYNLISCIFRGLGNSRLPHAVYGFLCGSECRCRERRACKTRHALLYGDWSRHRSGHCCSRIFQRRFAGICILRKSKRHCQSFRISARLCPGSGCDQYSVQLYGIFQRTFPLALCNGAGTCTVFPDSTAGFLFYECSAECISDQHRTGSAYGYRVWYRAVSVLLSVNK